MGHVKGIAVLDTLEFLDVTQGSEGIQQVAEVLDPGDRDAVMGQAVTAVSWVDLGALVRVIVTADEVLGRGDFELVRESGRYVARKHLRGIYKLLVRLATPESLIARTGPMWRRYHDMGELRAEELSPGHVLTRLTGFPNIPEHHELAQMAWVDEYMKIAGVRILRMEHTHCMARGDSSCITEYRW